MGQCVCECVIGICYCLTTNFPPQAPHGILPIIVSSYKYPVPGSLDKKRERKCRLYLNRDGIVFFLSRGTVLYVSSYTVCNSCIRNCIARIFSPAMKPMLSLFLILVQYFRPKLRIASTFFRLKIDCFK
jgi:hypothetical protein